MRYVEVAGRVLIGLVFVVAFAGKASGRAAFEAFVRSLRHLEVAPAAAVRWLAPAVVAAEAGVAVLVLVPLPGTGFAGFLLAAVLLSAFTVAVIRSLRQGNRAPCRCFGASTAPLSGRHVWRNAALILTSVLGAAATLAPGGIAPAPALVAAAGGLVGGAVAVAFDDIVGVLRPAG